MESKKLPQDIIEEILSRLPIKPLARFKCVSKLWYASISSRRFTKKHLVQTLSNPFENPLRFLLYWPNDSLGYESISSLDGAPEGDSKEHLDDPLGFNDPESSVYSLVIGSCDGIIVILYKFDKIALWNPSTRVSRELPSLSLSLSLSLSYNANQKATTLYGFGYDDSTNDYKVVKVFRSSTTNETTAYVFSTNNDTWRTIQGPDKTIIVTKETSRSHYFHGLIGVFLHGALHWLADSKKLGIILHFDLTTEKFTELATQPMLEDQSRSLEHLWVANDHLALLSTCFDPLGVDVWVMNEYGDGESWSKLFSSGDELIGYGPYGEYVKPLCFARNGELIVDVDGWCTVKYNVDDKRVEYLDAFEPEMHQCSLYVQSLVSPYPNSS